MKIKNKKRPLQLKSNYIDSWSEKLNMLAIMNYKLLFSCMIYEMAEKDHHIFLAPVCVQSSHSKKWPLASQTKAINHYDLTEGVVRVALLAP